MEPNSLLGKTALITGCGRGIGKAIAVTLAEYGVDIILNDISKETVEYLSKRINALGRKTLVHEGSVSNIQNVKELFSKTKKEFKRLDILVNNAGITRDNLLEKINSEDWDEVMKVNLKGTFYCTQQAVNIMKEQSSGKIINLTSVTALTGNIGQANYSASKAGIIGLTKTLARELARHKITVNAVAPGFIETPMTESLPKTVKEKIISDIPLGRAGKPQDVANLVKFLSSEDSAYITGQIISCNGGMYV